MHLIVCYDIPDDKRRARLRKVLMRFGNPVQYSVFECDLNQRQKEKMVRIVRSIISKGEDNIRCYLICGNCVRSAEVFGGASILNTKKAYVV